jgi:hypothetical protein
MPYTPSYDNAVGSAPPPGTPSPPPNGNLPNSAGYDDKGTPLSSTGTQVPHDAGGPKYNSQGQPLADSKDYSQTDPNNTPYTGRVGGLVSGASYNIDDAAFYSSNKGYETTANQQYWNQQRRPAFQMQSAQLGPTSIAQAAQIAANERSNNINIGQVQGANAAQLGAANQMGYAAINRQDMDGRLGQQQLIGQLQAQANGAAPSVAQGQLAAAQDRAAKQAMSMGASIHGGQSSALAQRNIMNSLSGSNQQAAHDAAQLKVQEQLNAQTQLGNQLGNMRQQDIGVNTSQAGMQQQSLANNQQYNNQFMMQNAQNSQQANMYNAQAYNQRQQEQAAMSMQNQQFNAGQYNTRNQNQAAFGQQANMQNSQMLNQANIQQGMFDQATNSSNLNANIANRQNNDAMSQYYFNAAMNRNSQDVNSAEQLETLKANQSVSQATIAQRASEASRAADQRDTQAAVSAGAAAVGTIALLASDMRAKEHIQPGETKVRSLLDALKPYQYSYIEPGKEGRAEGKFISPMAQDFEKSELGKKMVVEKDGTKMVNYGGHNIGTLWAAMATLNQDIKSLQKKRS